LALFAAITLLPYLLVSNLFVPVGAILAERFLYLPVAGCCLLTAALIARYGRLARLPALAAIVVLTGLMIARSLDWKDDATIFAATARNNPASPRAPYWLGTLAVDAGRAEAARAFFDASIRNWPAFASPWHDKGLLLARGGDIAGAKQALLEAIRLEPTWPTPKFNLALVLHRSGDLEGARRQARKAALLDPGNASYQRELGRLNGK
jgi:Flp pilus assembly protein TadD